MFCRWRSELINRFAQLGEAVVRFLSAPRSGRTRRLCFRSSRPEGTGKCTGPAFKRSRGRVHFPFASSADRPWNTPFRCIISRLWTRRIARSVASVRRLMRMDVPVAGETGTETAARRRGRAAERAGKRGGYGCFPELLETRACPLGVSIIFATTGLFEEVSIYA